MGTRGIRGIAATVGTLVLTAAACTGDGGSRATGSTADGGPASDPAPRVAPDPTGGWLGGEPDWVGDDPGRSATAEATMEESAGGAEMAVEDMASEAMSAEPHGGIGDGARPVAAEPPARVAGPLRAGSFDDNVDHEGFLAYLERVAGLGIVGRPFDPSGRSIVTVRDEEGRPAAGVEVVARMGDTGVRLRTTADGTARLLPALHGLPTTGDVAYSVAGGGEAVAPVGEDVELTGGPSRTVLDPVPLDVLFLLDATGSMGDEIDRLKETIDKVARRLSALDPAPALRFGMTLYRDRGDAFVVATHDFTDDVERFRTALAGVVADGGGDYAEALDEGLAAALAEPAWRDPAEAVQLVFLVADAPPHVGRSVPVPYPESVREATARGIKVFPVASSEADDQAELVFRQIAQATGAPFVFLSYGAAGAATGPATDITSTDYEELALDELVVRLVAEELDDLRAGGAPVTVPTTVAPTTTNPDGQ